MTQIALKIKNRLKKDKINCGVTHLGTIKPLDKVNLKKIISNTKKFSLLRNIFSQVDLVLQF